MTVKHWSNTELWDIVESCAKEFKLDPVIVGAIVQTESSGSTYAVKFEPNFRYRLMPYKFAPLCGIDEPTEDKLQAFSFGLMQVMGCVARELGHRGCLLELTRPGIGIWLGCKKLSQLMERYQNMDAAIIAYNRGSAIRNANGTFRKREYLDKVIQNKLFIEKRRSKND